ncbi:hypothetical protein [Algisphaera agarilytica]|nr:hypothetical protein [Algisphaera agarilytica]
MIAATLTAAVLSSAAHAASVPAGSQLIDTLFTANGGSGQVVDYDTLRVEIGFAQPGNAIINVLGPMDGTLFTNRQLTTDDDGTRLVATADNDPGFNDFVAALTQPAGRVVNSRLTALPDQQPDFFLANFAKELPASAQAIDWSDWQIDAVELVIKEIEIAPVQFNRDASGTTVFLQQEVNVFGRAAVQAVPTPTAAAAGLGLIGLMAGRRRKTSDED